MLNITNHQGNANQNHNEIPPHTGQNSHHDKVYEDLTLERAHTASANGNGAATMEN